jgi:hypothetical protein
MTRGGGDEPPSCFVRMEKRGSRAAIPGART